MVPLFTWLFSQLIYLESLLCLDIQGFIDVYYNKEGCDGDLCDWRLFLLFPIIYIDLSSKSRVIQAEVMIILKTLTCIVRLLSKLIAQLKSPFIWLFYKLYFKPLYSMNIHLTTSLHRKHCNSCLSLPFTFTKNLASV